MVRTSDTRLAVEGSPPGHSYDVVKIVTCAHTELEDMSGTVG